uniref:Uncharacterized protein n=1 Tax=Anopheles atroparvus TaxID=41427 RepID=A0A182JHG5_ANOAO
MKNRKFGMAGVGRGEMDRLTVPTKITPVKQMLAELQSDDEEPGLGYTHTLRESARVKWPDMRLNKLSQCGPVALDDQTGGVCKYNKRQHSRLKHGKLKPQPSGSSVECEAFT